MVIFVWLMALLSMRVEWRSVMVEYGDQCVIMAGILVMQSLSADKWDSKE